MFSLLSDSIPLPCIPDSPCLFSSEWSLNGPPVFFFKTQLLYKNQLKYLLLPLGSTDFTSKAIDVLKPLLCTLCHFPGKMHLTRTILPFLTCTAGCSNPGNKPHSHLQGALQSSLMSVDKGSNIYTFPSPLLHDYPLNPKMTLRE